VRVLVVNAGSSSLKLRVLADDDSVLASHDRSSPIIPKALEEIRATLAGLGPVDAVGHRVVHGGEEFSGPVVVTPEVERRLRALADLAPLHQSASLLALRATSETFPETPAVACFDTAFHSTIPLSAATYALPAEWRARWSMRRFGFHGLSHAYAARRAATVVGRNLGQLRMVTCHLGAGASLCAVAGGRSVDTTMGFSPLEGLVMATRSGSVDPGLILWLENHGGLSAHEVQSALEHRSGLMGLAGVPDMKEVLRRCHYGDEAATLAFEVYDHRLRAAIAAMATAMEGMDVLVFTGGVGEHAAEVRARAARALGFLGVTIDPERNEARAGDEDVSTPGATVRTLVVTSREDIEIAAQVRKHLR
jgi:acetate kinase